ncbi:hypothetical protein [Gluconobacter cerinus]|uniref:hypothetical protein n=1 Tax=Gluconobacter cerinus TaxID=38307 RepID=UPI001B8D6C1E|nr:hypothetical protein [Gluconobacter cerinus]MBS1026043.1 hypothetical protein [Gluconobacter cerinus]
MKRAFIFLVIIFMPVSSYADDLIKAHIRDKIFAIYGNSSQGYAYTFNGHAFTPDEYPATSKISKIIEGDGKTYVVTVDQDGGSASSPQYRAFDVTNNELVPSPLVGEGIGDHIKENWSVVDGDAVVTLQKDDGVSINIYHIREGRITSKKMSKDTALTGPVKPPGGDYAAFVNGMRLKEVFHLRAINPLLRKAFPGGTFDDVQKLAEEDYGSGFQSKSIGSVASVSQPHNSNSRYLAIAIEPSGVIDAIFSPENHQERFYGITNPLVKLELEKALH